MDTLSAISISGRLATMVFVPLLRQIAAVFLAVAIAKDCKARDNGSSLYWAIFTLLFPIFSGFVYLAYSRFFTHRQGKTEKDLKNIKTAKRLTACSIFTYFIALVMAIVALITTASSYFAEAVKKDFNFEDMFTVAQETETKESIT